VRPDVWHRRRRARRLGSESPLLSVVVPVYNNEPYLPTTLDSLLSQSVWDVEVIVVDDGSQDGSAAVAERYARRDARVRVLRQPNSGVSIARNNAIPECRGRFLTFADGDDVLPADAWSEMLTTLDRTGSDFVVGNAEREEVRPEGSRRFVTPLMRRNHRADDLRARIGDRPLMLADVFVWNKVFRTDFFREQRIWFPERTRYQDQVAMTQAFLAAETFDVLARTVYLWRVRPDNTSATQRRADLSNLRERLATKQMTVDLVEAHGDPALAAVLFDEILPIDMWEHFRAGAVGSEEYWQELVAGTQALWPSGLRPFESTATPAQQRLMGWLTVRDRRADLVTWLELLAERGARYDDEGRLSHPWSREVELFRTVPRGAE
jgi:hypothetical protein